MSAADDARYTVISADTHAGGSHAQYREFLEEKYLDDFDAWRGEYKNPFSDLGDQRRLRNWDDDMRNSQQDDDGVVGEVIFPNTVPPFFPSFVLFARPPKPDEYEHRLAGIRAHNRWLDDFCGRFPERRAGIGQIFLNDIDDAIEDVQLDQGARPARRHPAADDPARRRLDQAAQPPATTTGCGRCARTSRCRSTATAAPGSPAYARVPSSALIMLAEVPGYSRRPLLFMLLSGVFERFPRLKFVMTEQGCAWLPPLLDAARP